MNYWVVIPAAGVGKRMQADRPKQYLELLGRTVIEHTLSRFIEHPRVQGVVVAVSDGDPYWPRLELSAPNLYRVTGGQERCDSVLNGLRFLQDKAAGDDWILVHDAARPCLCTEDIERLLQALAEDPVGGILATPVRDTMKRDNGAGRIAATEEREGLWHALTPQMFRYGMLFRALDKALQEGAVITDEASAVEYLGEMPKLVEGRADNIKITRPEDLALAEFFLQRQGRDE